ncbi:MAG: D-alanyl-D-alanine carboxypeptidase family protein [Xanthobacteraceae bacterium]
MIGRTVFRAQVLGIVSASIAFGAVALETAPVRAEALILVDADSGKVLRAENATYPWYPASTTKLMTLYMTLSALRDHRITADTLFTVSPNASAQAPVKMGFPIGTQITVDNAIKMMMVKSANDMAVVLAEGVGGSIDDFAQQMTETAHRLGMSESNFVNPNGLPADGQIMSARDLAILARALIREFPQYSFYWHVPAIKFGRRIVRNYNPLLGRYAGADGMKTGFICASGFNMVATATRDNKQLIAVVLGAPSSSARAVKAAELLEGGFQQKPLSWLTPALGTVDQLQPMDATPPNLKDSMCGPHRRRPATEEDDPDAIDDNGNANPNANSNASPSQFSVLLSALRAPTPKNLALLPDAGPVVPTIVYTGPTRSPAQVDALAALPEAADPAPKKAKKKAAKAGAKAAAATPAADGAPGVTGQAKTGKPSGSNIHYTPSSSSASAVNPASGTAQKKPKPPTPAPAQ